VLKLTPHNLRHLLEVNLLPVVLPRHQAVNHLHQVQSRHQAVSHLLPVQHKLLLTIQIIHLQINLLHRVAAVVSPKQVKSKQPVIALANQDLV
jgi:hypothetical protein